jgi:hypothetical protein
MLMVASIFGFDFVSSGQNYSTTEVIINAKLLSFVSHDQIWHMFHSDMQKYMYENVQFFVSSSLDCRMNNYSDVMNIGLRFFFQNKHMHGYRLSNWTCDIPLNHFHLNCSLVILRFFLFEKKGRIIFSASFSLLFVYTYTIDNFNERKGQNTCILGQIINQSTDE